MWKKKVLNSVLCHSKRSLSPVKKVSTLMLFREVKGVYFQNHEKNSTESRWAGAADLIQLAQVGESRGTFLHSNGCS